jgi:hypothetical protein
MTDEEEAKLDQARLEERARFSDLLIKAGHENESCG